MISYFFSTFFLIPLFFSLNYYIFQYFFLFSFLMFIFIYVSDFYCNISYLFGFDLISIGLILLNFIIISLIVLCRVSLYIGFDYLFFIVINYSLLFIINVFFLCLRIFHFYFFFEFSLIPLVFLIVGFGYQPERLISRLYLFFYTLFGSLPLLLIIINIYLTFNTLFFDLLGFLNINIGLLIHFFFIFGFLVKLPMFIVHFWLPKAHVQAPVSGSIILAGVLLRIGGYGLIRFFFLIESSIISYSYIWYSFSVYGSFIVSLICFFQGDLKCLIAYSSVSHIGLCLLGILSLRSWGVLGSYFLILSHGLCSSCLFLVSNFYYERIHRRSFFINKGLIRFMPSLTPFWLLICCFNMGCPPRLNFLREIIILNSIIMYFFFSYYYFLIISFFCSCFRFFLFSFVHQGIFHNYYSFSIINSREYLLLLIHLIPLVWMVFIINFFI